MEPKFVQVKNYLLNLFQTERFETGRQTPTEFELMDTLNVSRNTVRKAVEELEKEGIVSRKHGSGTFFVSLNEEEDRAEKSGGLIGPWKLLFYGLYLPRDYKGY